jgi:putative flippase GtrA
MAQQLLILGFVKNPREMLGAASAGVAATVFDFVTLKLLVLLTPMSIPLAAFLAAGVGAVVCFVINKYISFRDNTPVSVEQLVRYCGVALTTGLLTAGAMKIVAVDWHVDVLLAKVLCAAAIFVAWTFPAQRHFVFKKPAVA